MNTANKIAVLSIGLFIPAAAFAVEGDEQAYIAKAKKGPGIPVPVSVVAPQDHRARHGDAAEIAFVVGTSGRPAEVTVKSSSDRSLGLAAREAVKRWRFEPARVDGVPVAVKVVLPFHVGPKSAEPTTLAAIR